MQNHSLKMQPHCIVHKIASAMELTNKHTVTILIDALITIVNRLHIRFTPSTVVKNMKLDTKVCILHSKIVHQKPYFHGARCT